MAQTQPAQTSQPGPIDAWLKSHRLGLLVPVKWVIVGAILGAVGVVLIYAYVWPFKPPIHIASSEVGVKAALDNKLWLWGLALGAALVMFFAPTAANIVASVLAGFVSLGWLLPGQVDWIWTMGVVIANALAFIAGRWFQHNVLAPPQTAAVTEQQPQPQQVRQPQNVLGGGLQFTANLQPGPGGINLADLNKCCELAGLEGELARALRTRLMVQTAVQHGVPPDTINAIGQKYIPQPQSQPPKPGDDPARQPIELKSPLIEFLSRFKGD